MGWDFENLQNRIPVYEVFFLVTAQPELQVKRGQGLSAVHSLTLLFCFVRHGKHVNLPTLIKNLVSVVKTLQSYSIQNAFLSALNDDLSENNGRCWRLCCKTRGMWQKQAQKRTWRCVCVWRGGGKERTLKGDVLSWLVALRLCHSISIQGIKITQFALPCFVLCNNWGTVCDNAEASVVPHICLKRKPEVWIWAYWPAWLSQCLHWNSANPPPPLLMNICIFFSLLP